MDVACEKCRRRFRIPDEKLSKDKTSILKCPKCGNRITVPPTGHQEPSPSSEEEENLFSFGGDENTGSQYNETDDPFDFSFAEAGKTALLCEPDPLIRKTVSQSLHLLEYQVTEANTGRDALKYMRYQNYDLIVVNELFDTRTPDTNGVLIYLERLNMVVRRTLFVVLLTERFRTMEPMIAFQKSVNCVINLNSLPDFEKIIQREMTDLELSYQVFKEGLLSKS